MTLAPLFQMKAGGEGRPSETHTGAMIALRPRQDHIDRLAVVDGEQPQELHTTILFMGKAADYSYDTRARIIQAMREVALKFRQVTGQGFGLNIWNPSGEEPCVVLQVGGTEMVDIRNAIVEALQGFDLLQVPEQHEPWVPHITLKYTDDFSDISDLTELAEGDVTYDAIRVAFGGIVDDIMFPASFSGDDGYAGGNRYTAVAPTLKTFSTRRVVDLFAPEVKVVRHVRTAGGARRYGQPIGSVIVGDGQALSHLKESTSEYDGFNKYTTPNGSALYTRKEAGKYVAYDKNDNVIHTAGSEEGLLKDLDGMGKVAADINKGPGGKAPTHDRYTGLTREESEYDGYEKYSNRNGDVLYRDEATDKWYDENDNPVSPSEVSKVNQGGRTDLKDRVAGVPFGFKEAESEYDGYAKFTGKGGKVVYRDQATGKFYDEDDKLIRNVSKFADITDITGRSISREEAGRIMNGTKPKPEAKPSPDKKPTATPKPAGKPDDDAAPKPAETDSKKPAPVKPAADTSAIEKRLTERGRAGLNGTSIDPSDENSRVGGVRRSLDGTLDATADLNAVLDKIENSPSKTVPAEQVEELRRVALRQRDIRNRRKLMLFAQQLSEEKIFMDLVSMDYKLRGLTLSTKIITPGGRVGSAARLGKPGGRQNWVDKVGGLPRYIRIVANGLKGTHGESRAIALAVAAMKRWARGGNNVTPKVQAAAAEALAEWEAKKAAA